MKRILLSNGEFTLISDADFIWSFGYSWFLTGKNYLKSGGYPTTTINGKQYKMHRLIAERMGLDCANQIDHIDGDTYNNQRKNLRAATNSQNQMNMGLRDTNKSGHTGVHWHIRDQVWQAYIWINRNCIHLGNYNRIEQAIFARKIAEQKYFKEFANV